MNSTQNPEWSDEMFAQAVRLDSLPALLQATQSRDIDRAIELAQRLGE